MRPSFWEAHLYSGEHPWQGLRVVCMWFEVTLNGTVDMVPSSMGWMYRFVFIFIRALFHIRLLEWRNGNGFLFCIANGKLSLLLDSLYNYIFFGPKSIWLSLVWKMIWTPLRVFVGENFWMTDEGSFQWYLHWAIGNSPRVLSVAEQELLLYFAASFSKLRNMYVINLNYSTTYFTWF